MALKFFLLARGAFNVVFGLLALIWAQSAPPQHMDQGGFYAMVDGVLALLLALALLRGGGRWLFALAAFDASLRLAFGAWIVGNPGMLHFVIGNATFFTLFIVGCMVLGLGGALYLLVAHSERALPDSDAFAPGLVVCAFLVVLGAGLAFGILDHDRGLLLAVHALALGLALCAVGLRIGRPVELPVSLLPRLRRR